MKNKKSVLVGLSGGVDSAVSAKLLLDQGYDVAGLYINMLSGKDIGQDKVRRICKKLGINLLVVDAVSDFKKEVIDKFISEYEAGRTPNPCVICNPQIKFRILFKIAKKNKIDLIATGHYVRLCREFPVSISQIDLLEAKDKKKDQSYFLYNLGENDLKKIIFPLGNYKKEEIKQLARVYGLVDNDIKESQDICFVKHNDINSFLDTFAGKLKKKGDVLDTEGVKIAEHDGLIYYTIGQRGNFSKIDLQKSKLLGKKDMIPPLYVVKLNVKKNQLVLGLEKELYSNELVAKEINWINPQKIRKSFWATAKIRSCSKKAKCRVICCGKKANVKFNSGQRAITAGQSIVFYNKEKVLGGGIIS